MKKFYLFLLSIFLLNVFSVNAQSTDGTDFWLTFGKNWREGTSTANPPGENNTIVVPRIRIVSKDLVTEVQIVFTNLSATSPDRVISRTLQPRSAETIALNTNQKNAAYLTSSGTSSLSIHITSDHPITAYALNQCNKSADATNILPVPALGTDYYQISYQPQGNWATPMYGAPSCQDAYAVIATEDNTRVFHANGTTPVATLNTGQVYYRTSGSDMTGTHVTADKPVAFFALNQGTWIKNSSSKDCLFQQLAPVDTWGYNFLIPVTNISGNNHIDRVRIVASQDSTHVTRHGGSHVSAPGGQTGLTPYTLNAGQFIELEVFYNQDGCFIEADKPVGVCPYLITPPSTSDYDPAQAWLPSMEQLATAALIAPFKPTSGTSLTTHMALILAPTDAAPNTRVTIGTGLPTTLPSNGWRANAASGMSFYNYDMTDLDASYRFTNTDGIIVMAYGYGPAESYYYLGYSSMLNLNAYFEANNVHNGLIENMLFCDEYEIEFIATLENVFNLKWYINDPLKLQPLHENEDIWEQTFSAGNYSIVMYVEFIDGTTNEFEGILHIGANITATADPGIGGTVVPPTECVQVGETVTLTAIPNTPDYVFDGWTQGNTPVLGGETLTFTVTGDRDLTAHFKLNNVDITTSVAPSNVGTTEGDDSYQVGSIATVKATADSCHTFLNWTDDKGRELSTDNPYSFTVTGQLHLIAHFTLNSYTVTLYADPSVGSSLSGDGEYNCGDYVTVTATESDCYTFENWTDNKGEVVSDENPYTFNIENTCDLTANFTLNTYKVASSSHPEEGGTTLGDNTDFPCGDYIILTATPDPCYNFVNWTEDGKQVSTDNPYNFKVTEPHNVVANFEIKLYNVFLLANPSTSNEVDGYGYNFDCGDPININASPGDCYTFSNWTNSAGEVVSTDPNFTFTILSDTTLTA
ncbi:MAG: hypothetical protein FWH59_02140, partial [Lentimicrobiaceae bacterium]|nr:hypothetical protein [Lentimicrobiaceae bacterium]